MAKTPAQLDKEINQALASHAGATPRDRGVAWKMGSLSQLQAAIAGLQAARQAFGTAADAAKTALKEVCQGGQRLAKVYEQNLDENNEETYYDEVDTLEALKDIRSPDAEALKETSQEAGAAINELIKAVKEVLSSVQKVKL